MFCIFVIEFIKYKMTEIVNNPVQPVKSDKTSKLILSLLFDGIGMLSYIVPVFAEVTDLVWAPISGIPIKVKKGLANCNELKPVIANTIKIMVNCQFEVTFQRCLRFFIN